ncbi:MAG: PEP-CTERM sorting domain-containing protein [Gemmataceae bacterium]
MNRWTPRSPLTRMLAIAVATMISATVARAGLLPTSVTTNPENGNFRWTYAIVLPTDMKLQAGNYFTIYDFAGYTPGGETAPTGWTFSAEKSGPTPDLLKPTDSPDLWNLTWKYNGPTIPTGQLGLGNFWAISTFSDSTTSSFTAETNRTSDGLSDSNITTTTTPTGSSTPPPGVPEPATLALAALGLPFAGAFRLLKKKKA